MKNALTFSTYINSKLNAYAESLENGVFFGQNVITGSRISGLGARMDSHKHILSFNTPNSIWHGFWIVKSGNPFDLPHETTRLCSLGNGSHGQHQEAFRKLF